MMLPSRSGFFTSCWRKERARRQATTNRYSCQILNRESEQLPFRIQPILQGVAFLPPPLFIQFIGSLRNAPLMGFSTPCGLFSRACLLSRRICLRRCGRLSWSDGSFLAHCFPPRTALSIVVNLAKLSVVRRHQYGRMSTDVELECLPSETLLGLLFYCEVVLHRLHARDLPGNPRRLGAGHEILNFAAQRDHSRVGLGMNTGFLQ